MDALNVNMNVENVIHWIQLEARKISIRHKPRIIQYKIG